MALKPGKYLAKIVDCGLFKGDKGPSAVLTMRTKDELGNVVDMNWFGSFNGGAKEITLRTLVQCGSKATTGQELASELNRWQGEGVPMKPIPFDTTKDFEIDVQMNEYNGKTTPRIAFINLPGGAGFRTQMSQDDSKVLLGGLNLGADLLMARQKTGVSKPAGNGITPSFSEDDVPLF